MNMIREASAEVLIESDWNLKMRIWLRSHLWEERINRIRLEFKEK